VVDEKLKAKFQSFAARGLDLQDVTKQSSGDTTLDAQVFGVTQTILYLQGLNGSDKTIRENFHFEYSAWVFLNIPPVYALSIFWHDNANLLVPPADVLKLMERQTTVAETVILDLCIAYIELVTDSTQAFSKDASLHNRRIQLYLKKIERVGVDGTSAQSVQKKLLKFLTSSTEYNAASVISSFSAPVFKDTLQIERVSILRRMQRHDMALDILVHQRKDYDSALKYCEEDDTAKDVFVIYLEALLSDKMGPDGVKRVPCVEEALKVLRKHPDKMDPTKVISLLPDNTSIHLVSTWLMAVLRAHSQTRYHSDTMSKLSESLAQQTSEALMESQKESVTITSATKCQKCHRTIQDSVFVKYPNDVIVHQACVGDDEKMCPVTHKRFNEFDRFK